MRMIFVFSFERSFPDFIFILSYLESTTTSLSSSPPKHKNPKLEQKINEKKTASKLDFSEMNLTDSDMEIVVYHLLENTKVSESCIYLTSNEERESRCCIV